MLNFTPVPRRLVEAMAALACSLVLIGCHSVSGTGRSQFNAYSVSQEPEPLRFRITGMALTFTVLVVAALMLLTRSANGLLTG